MDGPSRPCRHPGSAHAAEGARRAAWRWARSGGSRRTTPRWSSAPQFRTIVDHGIQAGIHGDGVHIAPLNPWQHIYFAATGVNSFGDKVNGDQQITRQEALRLFTSGNSWFLRMEEKIGTIEPGKLGRSRRPRPRLLHGAGCRIRKIRSVLTVVDGRIVHDASALVECVRPMDFYDHPEPARRCRSTCCTPARWRCPGTRVGPGSPDPWPRPAAGRGGSFTRMPCSMSPELEHRLRGVSPAFVEAEISRHFRAGRSFLRGAQFAPAPAVDNGFLLER